MLQWGTPKDLEEYITWSKYFKEKPLEFRGVEHMTLLLPMAGAGSRFKMVGYDIPKPMLLIQNKPMVVQAINSLVPCKKNVFVCLKDHLDNYSIKDILNGTIIDISGVTQGQACTCEIGIKQAHIDGPLLISACDNGAYYDVNKFYNLIDTNVDVIVWSFTNNPTSKLYPHMYAWLDVDSQDNIVDVSIKKKFENKEASHCIIGTMYFRNTSIFLEGLKEIYEKNLRTNGEFYVDNLIMPLVEKGYIVKVFEVKNYLCWGTPNDYKTYNYWDTYFNTR